MPKPKREPTLDTDWGLGVRFPLTFDERRAVMDGADVLVVLIQDGSGFYLSVEGIQQPTTSTNKEA